MGFLSEDVQKAMAFGDFISKNARWKLTTAEAIQLTKHFSWYNSLVKRIEDNVFEVQRVLEPSALAPASTPAPTPAPAKSPTGKK